MFDAFIQAITDNAVDISLRIIGALLILIIGFKLANLAVKLIRNSKAMNRADSGARSFIASLIKIGMKIVVLLSAAAVLGLPMTTIATLLGSAGLAIGLALQGGLSNLAGGVIILIFKPFAVGEYISFGDISGTVDSIEIFYTTLISPDNKKIVVPNGTLTNQTVTDYSKMPIRRVDFTFTASYDADIEEVKSALIDVSHRHHGVLDDPAPNARLNKHGGSALEFVLRVWCEQEKYWDVYFDLTEDVKREFDRRGISIPYNQLDVHIKNEDAE